MTRRGKPMAAPARGGVWQMGVRMESRVGAKELGLKGFPCFCLTGCNLSIKFWGRMNLGIARGRHWLLAPADWQSASRSSASHQQAASLRYLRYQECFGAGGRRDSSFEIIAGGRRLGFSSRLVQQWKVSASRISLPSWFKMRWPKFRRAP